MAITFTDRKQAEEYIDKLREEGKIGEIQRIGNSFQVVRISEQNSDMSCPFCKETGFDKFGLKDHILNRCSSFENIEGVD